MRKAEEEAKRRAEEEAKRKAEENKQKAEEEARRQAEARAKCMAEEEEKHRAEEAARHKAEEDAKRKAEEAARRKGEEEAKRRAEEQAKRKAEEEAKRKAEEARRKAEEEAKQKAEEAKQKAEEEARRQTEEYHCSSVMVSFSDIELLCQLAKLLEFADLCDRLAGSSAPLQQHELKVLLEHCMVSPDRIDRIVPLFAELERVEMFINSYKEQRKQVRAVARGDSVRIARFCQYCEQRKVRIRYCYTYYVSSDQLFILQSSTLPG